MNQSFTYQICSGYCEFLLFVVHKGKYINSDWLADQWDEQSVSGHAQIHKGRMKGDFPEMDTAQTPKRLDGRLALLQKI